MHPELVAALKLLNWTIHIDGSLAIYDEDSVCNKSETDISETEREALTLARLGQGSFRIALVKYWGSCAVTGVSEPTVLRASHIKPWRDCDNKERLDTFNGLLLAAHIDALFDKGLITFEFNGEILLAPIEY